MANYIPWYGKKRERLAQLESVFLDLLRNETDLKQLTEAADRVRLARARALKAKQAQLSPYAKNEAAIAHLDREIQFWLALTPDEVIKGYRDGTLPKRRAMAAQGPTT